MMSERDYDGVNSNGDARVKLATALFFEADRLDSFAYSILEIEHKTDAVWKSFSDAKSIAAAKRDEANRVWGKHQLPDLQNPE